MLAAVLSYALAGRAEAKWSVWEAPYTIEDIRAIPEWPALNDKVGVAWLDQDIDTLEKLLSRDPSEHATDGSSFQNLAFRSIENIVASSELVHPSQSKYDPVLTRWETLYPTSAAPGIIRALMLLRFANRHLDSGDGGRIVFPGFNPADAGFQEAKETLQRFARSAAKYPFWYSTMIRIEAARKVGFDDLFILADEARAAAPDDIDPQVAFLEHLLTTTGSSRADSERIVRSLCPGAEGKVDETRYARMYRSLFAKVYHYRLFEQSDADWPMMRTGLTKLEATGATDTTTSQLAAIACLGGDLQVATSAFNRLAGKIVHSVWILPKFYEDCRAWTGSVQPK